MPLLRHPALWFTAFSIWFGVLWWLSSEIREFPEQADFFGADKVIHFGYFFGGAGLLSAAIYRSRPEMPALRRILITIGVVALAGIIDELHQSQVPGRDATVSDFIADALGGIAGALVFQRMRRVID